MLDGRGRWRDQGAAVGAVVEVGDRVAGAGFLVVVAVQSGHL
jgi:hypothetical protein